MLSVWLRAALAAPVEDLPDGPAPVPPTPADADAVVKQGALLYRAAGCVGCHSPPYQGAQHLGGGRKVPTAFGTFYAPNISPSADGIGDWTEADFVRALREGRSPDGRAYWPMFPTMAYTGMSDDDLHALWAWLRLGPPVDGTWPEADLRFPYGMPGLLALWRSLAFREGPLEPDPTQSAAWNRGAYLVRAVAYCDQCHTPRAATGVLRKRHDMAGGANPAKGELHPNLTPHPTAGIGSWTEDDIVAFLGSGRKPDGSVADPTQVMAEKITDSLSYLPEADLRAIAVYLRSLPADDYDPSQLLR